MQDDWLTVSDDYNQENSGANDYSEDSSATGKELLSSRRRIYPTVYLGDYDLESENTDQDLLGASRGQPEALQMTKKDLESLIYQADPALTVARLSPQPKIAFRKFDLDLQQSHPPSSSSSPLIRATAETAASVEAPVNAKKETKASDEAVAAAEAAAAGKQDEAILKKMSAGMGTRRR